jgi:hypothetical protein
VRLFYGVLPMSTANHCHHCRPIGAAWRWQ